MNGIDAEAQLPRRVIRCRAYSDMVNAEIAWIVHMWIVCQIKCGFNGGCLMYGYGMKADPNIPLKCQPFLTAANKSHKGHEDDDFAWAGCLSARAAAYAISGSPNAAEELPSSAGQIRSVIGKDAHHVNLNDLVAYCWEI